MEQIDSVENFQHQHWRYLGPCGLLNYISHEPHADAKEYYVVRAYPMNDIPNETVRKHSEFLEN